MYVAISPLRSGRGTLFDQSWILFTQGFLSFVPSLFEIGEERTNVKFYSDRTIGNGLKYDQKSYIPSEKP